MPDKSLITEKSVDLCYEAVAAIVRERIRHGLYAPGCRVPPQRVLAEELGVSRRFVYMAYDSLTADGIIERRHNRRPFVPLRSPYPAAAYGLSPTATFGFRNGNSAEATAVKTIAAVLPSHPLRPDGLAIIAGIHRVLTDSGSEYRMQLYDTHQMSRAAADILEVKALAAIGDLPNVAGLIWSSQGGDEQIVDFLRDHPHIAPVFIERLPTCAPVDFVGVDDVESARCAVDFLFDQGHRRIAHIVVSAGHSSTTDRMTGYRAAHVERGVAIDDDLLVELGGGSDRIERALDYLYDLPSPPTAVLAGNDFMAYELIAEAEERGIRVPRDLSVIGHGNIDQFAPRQFLSSVAQPFELIGRSAARLLLRRLQSRSVPEDSYQHIILQAPLILRKSCDLPGIDHPNTVAARTGSGPSPMQLSESKAETSHTYSTSMLGDDS